MHSSFYQSSSGLHMRGFECSFSIYGHCSRSPGSYCTFKKSSLEHATLRICSDNPEIPSCWITTVFFILFWHHGRGVKSWLAARGRKRGETCRSPALAFHLLPASRQAPQINCVRHLCYGGNMKHIQSWICHCTHIIAFSNNGIITQIFFWDGFMSECSCQTENDHSSYQKVSTILRKRVFAEIYILQLSVSLPSAIVESFSQLTEFLCTWEQRQKVRPADNSSYLELFPAPC